MLKYSENGEKEMSFTEVRDGALVTMRAPLLAGQGGVRHAFTTRYGGVSTGIWESLNLGTARGDDPACVRENYRIIGRHLGFAPERLVFAVQVHGDTVRAVTSNDCRGDVLADSGYTADALITNEPHLPLIVFVADCIGILLYDPEGRAVGAVHAGWRGTVQNIVGKAVREMQRRYGCQPENLLAAISPGIGPCCFETGEEVADAVRALPGMDPQPYLDYSRGKCHVDLKGVNRALLLAAGLRAQHIDVSDECTRCSNQKYWSHRATNGQRGCQGCIIMLV